MYCKIIKNVWITLATSNFHEWLLSFMRKNKKKQNKKIKIKYEHIVKNKILPPLCSVCTCFQISKIPVLPEMKLKGVNNYC